MIVHQALYISILAATCYASTFTMLRVESVIALYVNNVTVIGSQEGSIEHCVNTAMLLGFPSTNLLLAMEGGACLQVDIPIGAVFSPADLTQNYTLIDIWASPDQYQRVLKIATPGCPRNYPFALSSGQTCCSVRVSTGASGCSGGNVSFADPVGRCAGATTNCISPPCITSYVVMASITVNNTVSRCPSGYPFNSANGYMCCSSVFKLSNASISPACDGSMIGFSDTHKCCSSYTPCPNQNQGCSICYHANVQNSAHNEISDTPNYQFGITSMFACQQWCQSVANCTTATWNIPYNQGCFLQGPMGALAATPNVMSAPKYCP